MSTTVNDLIKLLDTEENRYGGATGKPRELNISINGNFCGGIESAELDGYGDGLVTEITLDVEIPDVEEYYGQEIRNKAIEEFAEEIKSTLPIAVHRDCSEVDYEVHYALHGLRHRIDRIAEQLKGETI